MASTFGVMLVAMLFAIFLLPFAVAFMMPFVGALIRLRANYNPRAVGFEGTENSVGPRLTGVLGTLKRVKRLEGVSGLYKGAFAMGAWMGFLWLSGFLIVHGKEVETSKGTIIVPERVGFVPAVIFMVVMTIISLPMAIIVNRAVITPYQLPMNVRQSLRILLSGHEMARPMSLYMTPGLLPATILRSVCVTLIGRGMLRAFLGKDRHPATWRLVFFVLFQALSAAWLTPLDVVITKLSVQPNLGGEVSMEDPEQDDTPEGLRFAGTDEDVVGLRPTSDPYVGFLDPVRKIIDEEGWQALYRGWWWTSLGAIFGPK